MYSSAVTHSWVAPGWLPNFSEHGFPHLEIRGNDNAFLPGLSEDGERTKCEKAVPGKEEIFSDSSFLKPLCKH